MGTSWNYFKRYEINPEEDGGDDIIHYLDGDSFDITFHTSAKLASIIENSGVLLPVYDGLEPPSNKKLDDLVEPKKVAEAAIKGIELLNQQTNPLVKIFFSSDELEPLFDDTDLRHHTIDQLNENIRYYLERMVQLSNDGHFFVRERN